MPRQRQADSLPRPRHIAEQIPRDLIRDLLDRESLSPTTADAVGNPGIRTTARVTFPAPEVVAIPRVFMTRRYQHEEYGYDTNTLRHGDRQRLAQSLIRHLMNAADEEFPSSLSRSLSGGT